LHFNITINGLQLDKSPNCNPFFIPSKVSLGHLLISFPNNQPLLNSVFEVVLTIIVKQNCFWKNVVRRMQDVRSINKRFRWGKGKLLFAYDAPMAFQGQLCLALIPQ